MLKVIGFALCLGLIASVLYWVVRDEHSVDAHGQRALERPSSPQAVTIGDFTYRVPRSGDSEYEDYQEMVNHPRYARFNNQGAAQYYDPEWRAAVEGRRRVPVNDLTLIGGASSLEELGKFVLLALEQDDSDALDQFRMSRDEYQLLCWPEFPQSRPFLRIPEDEAWTMHFANMRKGAVKTFNRWRGRNFELIQIKPGTVEKFTNFDLISDVDLVVNDVDTGASIVIRALESVIVCRGTVKVFMYRE